MKWPGGFIVFVFLFSAAALAQEPTPLTLDESIRIALNRSLDLHSAILDVTASQFRTKAAFTDFLPRWTGQYRYDRLNRPTAVATTGGISAVASRDNYDFNTTVTQPLFAGGSILSNYRLERYGVDISRMGVEVVKRDLVLRVREGYFNILNAQKLRDIAEQNVKLFEAQLQVTRAFFEVGIVARNDVLQGEVRLAQARQDLVRAENGVALAKASFNNLLRRDIDAPVNVVDILQYQPFPLVFEETVEEALRQRPEIRSAELSISQAREAVKIARSGYFPALSLSGNYDRLSDDPTLSGDASERWNIRALATFTIWEWGRTAYNVGESRVRVNQAEDSRIQLVESIVLEVKQTYLNMLQAEKNIGVAEKAIEQAEENLRMNEERYRYQVATATDLLNAVTFLTQARVNYYTALSDFNIAKSRLERAMGRMPPV
jgi:outer membrane protein TolC